MSGQMNYLEFRSEHRREQRQRREQRPTGLDVRALARSDRLDVRADWRDREDRVWLRIAPEETSWCVERPDRLVLDLQLVAVEVFERLREPLSSAAARAQDDHRHCLRSNSRGYCPNAG